MKSWITVLLILLGFAELIALWAQDTTQIVAQEKITIKKVILPAALIAYGVVGKNNSYLKGWNKNIKNRLGANDGRHTTIDNYTEFLPIAAVYGLNAAGVKGKHNLRDRSVVLVSAFLISTAAVNTVKWISITHRPDESGDNSFPSGHTATAFLGAEFLRQEYGHVSVWYGIGGYAVATGTGFLRIYNNRHWLTDVAAGAGIGMLSTTLAYHVQPYLSKKLFKRSSEGQAMVLPFYAKSTGGVYFALSF
ncbi:MAG: phosphatase PAP2 family protein [Saprospiraceae bacterium]|nr:phosphatase PAP2 family protein [Saprospiraceae bacterium]